MEPITFTGILLVVTMVLAFASGNSGRSSNAPAVVINTQPMTGSHSVNSAAILFFTALLLILAIAGTFMQRG